MEQYTWNVKGLSGSGGAVHLRSMFGAAPCLPAPAPGGPAGALGPFRAAGTRLSDREIRAALLLHWAAAPAIASAVVLEEVECWRGYVRADYLCVANDELSIVEIKSDRDCLRRFQEQVRVYSAFADRVTLVVGWSLAARALRAAPWWWDVLLAEGDESHVRLVPLRDGSPNRSVTSEALAAMLPVTEVRRIARKAGLAPTYRRGRDLRQFVAAQVPSSDLRTEVCLWLARSSQKRVMLPS